MDALESKNVTLELALSKAQKESSDAIEKLQEIEQKCSQLQENVKRFFCISLWIYVSLFFAGLNNFPLVKYADKDPLYEINLWLKLFL